MHLQSGTASPSLQGTRTQVTGSPSVQAGPASANPRPQKNATHCNQPAPHCSCIGEQQTHSTCMLCVLHGSGMMIAAPGKHLRLAVRSKRQTTCCGCSCCCCDGKLHNQAETMSEAHLGAWPTGHCFVELVCLENQELRQHNTASTGAAALSARALLTHATTTINDEQRSAWQNPGCARGVHICLTACRARGPATLLLPAHCRAHQRPKLRE